MSSARSTSGPVKASVADVHAMALAMPGTVAVGDRADKPVYQVRGKSFVFFRNPRPDAVDPATGERYADVIVFWVESCEDKRALVTDPSTPFFTTPHFNGHLSVLIQASRLGAIDREELREIIADAWLSRAPKRLAAEWLSSS